jgi:hypothetical protein
VNKRSHEPVQSPTQSRERNPRQSTTCTTTRRSTYHCRIQNLSPSQYSSYFMGIYFLRRMPGLCQLSRHELQIRSTRAHSVQPRCRSYIRQPIHCPRIALCPICLRTFYRTSVSFLQNSSPSVSRQVQNLVVGTTNNIMTQSNLIQQIPATQIVILMQYYTCRPFPLEQLQAKERSRSI